MTTEPRGLRVDRGFTLIEVLVAMVLLAIGLLGVAGMGIIAARGLAGADARSQFAVSAADDLELALGQIGTGTVPQKCLTIGPFADRLSRTVTRSPDQVGVTVTMRPGTGRTVSLPPLTLTRTTYVPTSTNITISGTPCP